MYLFQMKLRETIKTSNKIDKDSDKKRIIYLNICSVIAFGELKRKIRCIGELFFIL